MHASEEAAFVERIREDHDDDRPRLIYADWLDEHGQHERADFIRVQCALEALPEGDASGNSLREYECSLLERHGREWATGVAEHVSGYSFRRGVIEAITVTPDQFARIGRNVYERFPVRRLRFIEMIDSDFRFFRSSTLSYLAELDLTQCMIDEVASMMIGSARHLRALRLLDLGFTSIKARALAFLLNSPAVTRLRSLRLNENPTTDAASIRVISDSTQLTELISIDLSGNQSTCAVLAPLLRLPCSLPSLRVVHLEGNLLGRDMQTFTASPLLERICRLHPMLDLSANEIDANGAGQLAATTCLQPIESLILDRNLIRDGGRTRLAESANLSALRRLSLVQCGLTEDGIRSLANSPLIGQLQFLDVRENLLTRESLDRLRGMGLRKSGGAELTLVADEHLPHSRPTQIMRLYQRPPGE